MRRPVKPAARSMPKSATSASQAAGAGGPGAVKSRGSSSSQGPARA